MKARTWLCLVALACVLPTAAHAAIAKGLDREVDKAKKAMADSLGPAAAERIQALQAAIERGERASADLHTQIQALETEKAKLEQVQTVLTSGLVGAIVTALVAIMGAVASARTSRAERDLKRLDVVEKVVALKKAGVGVPRDIAEAYQGPAEPPPSGTRT